MAEIARALGLGSKIEHGGKEYTLSPWTYSLQAAFEQYLEENALKVCKKMRPYTTEVEYRELLAGVHRDIAAGHYAFGGQAVADSMTKVPHLTQLLFLMLKPNHPEVTVELAREVVQGKVEEVWEKIAQANADPNPTTRGPEPASAP